MTGIIIWKGETNQDEDLGREKLKGQPLRRGLSLWTERAASSQPPLRPDTIPTISVFQKNRRRTQSRKKNRNGENYQKKGRTN